MLLEPPSRYVSVPFFPVLQLPGLLYLCLPLHTSKIEGFDKIPVSKVNQAYLGLVDLVSFASPYIPYVRH